MLEKRAESESFEEERGRSTGGGGRPGSRSAADWLEREVDRAGSSHERNAGWKAGGGEAKQTRSTPERSCVVEWKVSLDVEEAAIWEDVKKIFPGIMKEPVGTKDRWLEKGGYYIKMHCRRRVAQFDPRRGYMPKDKIGPERITVMRTSGPIFVLGGDYTVGSLSGLREFVGFTIFKKVGAEQEVGS